MAAHGPLMIIDDDKYDVTKNKCVKMSRNFVKIPASQ